MALSLSSLHTVHNVCCTKSKSSLKQKIKQLDQEKEVLLCLHLDSLIREYCNPTAWQRNSLCSAKEQQKPAPCRTNSSASLCQSRPIGVPRSVPGGPQDIGILSNRPKGQFNHTEVCYVPLAVPKGVQSAQLCKQRSVLCLSTPGALYPSVSLSMVQSALYSQSLTGEYRWHRHRVVVPARQPMQPGGPVRQPYAGVDFMTMNLATGGPILQFVGTGGSMTSQNVLCPAGCFQLCKLNSILLVKLRNSISKWIVLNAFLLAETTLESI